MDLRVDVVTLAVPDLAEARAFYVDRLGWEPAFEVDGEVVFLAAGKGRYVGLFGRKDLGEDIGTDAPPPFDVGNNCASEQDVDEVFAAMTNAGARQLKPPTRASWGGYHAYVEAPDGTVWELAYNPQMRIDEDGVYFT